MGLEPTTYGTTIRRSNQLSYIHHFAFLRQTTGLRAASLRKCDAKLDRISQSSKFPDKKTFIKIWTSKNSEKDLGVQDRGYEKKVLILLP